MQNEQMMYTLFRRTLFRLDAEQAHDLTLWMLHWAGLVPPIRLALKAMFDLTDRRLETEVFGVKFKNRIGLAAGLDKNGIAIPSLSAIGFGHIEVGTVTLKPQHGNPRPRVHRVPEAGAIVNSMGFPSRGIDELVLPRVQARLGINIGKNKDTPLERATDDYRELLRRVYTRADYVALNISSPNTPGLRQLQSPTIIHQFLQEIADERNRLVPRVPLLVKIAPDLTFQEIDDILDAIHAAGLDGIIATNTTTERAGLPQYALNWPGGVSGAPLARCSTNIIRHISQRTNGHLPIIGVGGIASAQDALEKLDAGASLVQLFTGFIYRGPGLLSQINRALLER
jgi:dihydroorotate dehydrogenase